MVNIKAVNYIETTAEWEQWTVLLILTRTTLTQVWLGVSVTVILWRMC